MPSTNPITMNYLADAVSRDRQVEQEQRRLEKEANISSQKNHASLFFGLSRGLTSLGARLQENPQRRVRRA
jgi:hypothetical protein